MVSPNKFIVPDILPAIFCIEILDTEQKPISEEVMFKVIIDGGDSEIKKTDNYGILRLPKPKDEVKLSLIGEVTSRSGTKSVKPKVKTHAPLPSPMDQNPKSEEAPNTIVKVTAQQPWHVNPEKELLYLDAGAWQGHEDGTFWTNFVLISGNGVALCNYYDVSTNNKSSADYIKDLKTKGEGEFKGCEPILDFLKSIDSKKPLSHLLSFYRSISKPFWDNNSMLFVIGDLHLHLFRQKEGENKALLDNFIRNEGAQRKSLENDFCEFLNKIYEYQNSNRNIKVEMVQAGDLLDIWEVDSAFQTLDKIQKKIWPFEPWDKLFKEKLFEGVLSTINPPTVNPDGLYKYMQKKVFPRIFTGINKLMSLQIPLIILRGNHDNILLNTEKFNKGPDYLVHIEHGHNFDDFNKPENETQGRFLTTINEDMEYLGLGDWVKSLEEKYDDLKWIYDFANFLAFKDAPLPLTVREKYIKAAIDEANRYKNDEGKILSIFIMAHTHKPYAKKNQR